MVDTECEICRSTSFKYNCPRCNIKYCSLVCYRSEAHGDCSEAFYKECVVNELQQQTSSSEDKKKVLEMLQRVENEPELDSEDEDLEDLDSDDDGAEAGDLADRLAEVDLDDADAVWERLTDAEKQEFKSIVYNGEVEKIVKSVEPWWKLRLPPKPISDVLEDEKKIKGFLKKCPKIPSNIKDFTTVSSKPPAPCIIYNIANVIAAYTYIFHFYNSDHLSYELEATDNLLAICENLKSNANFENIAGVVDSVMMSSLGAGLFSSPETKKLMLEDLRQIFDGPGDDSHENCYILAALSDIQCLLKATKQKFKSKLEKQEYSGNPINTDRRNFSEEFPGSQGKTEFENLTDPKLFTSLVKKIEFYQSFIKFCYKSSSWPVTWDVL